MKIYIYKTAKERIKKDHAKGGHAAYFIEDMDYLLGTTQEVEYIDLDGDYAVYDWYISPCACRVIKEK